MKKDEPGLYMFYSDNIYGPYNDYLKICAYDDARVNIEGMYAPMTHEKLMKKNGKELALLVSQWIPLYNPITIHLELEKFR